MAPVQRSPAAIKLLGSPIEQHGFTGGRTTNSNGDDFERLTLIGSHLEVRIGRNGVGETISSGPFDCPALHR
ncbi:MAG TPA: hypothetical protein VMT95_14050 [Candidatus Binatia bacterium]|nr:hypothetical protein [Candidatus Binatia bacterium]